MKDQSPQEPDFMPELKRIRGILEKHCQDMCDIEFTLERGKLYVLGYRIGKRTGRAAIRIAIEMFLEGIISGTTLLSRLRPEHFAGVLKPRLVLQTENKLIARGLNASSGVAVGVMAMFHDTARELSQQGQAFIFVRPLVESDDVETILHSSGVLTCEGGATSHAAVICRQLGKPCVAGASDLLIDFRSGEMHSPNGRIREHEYISINGSTGNVYSGKAGLESVNWRSDPELFPQFRLWLTIFDAISTNGYLPSDNIGTLWFMRDMLIHNINLDFSQRNIGRLSKWPASDFVAKENKSFRNLADNQIHSLPEKLKAWLVPRENKENMTLLWIGLRNCLFRLLSSHVGIGRHPAFYRPLFDPLQTIFKEDDIFGIYRESEDDCTQIVGEEFFSINHYVPEYIEIESLRLYAAIRCSVPHELWRIDRTNPSGEKLLEGSHDLLALKLIVNDAVIELDDLATFYDYFRRKEYFWAWYKAKGVVRSQIIEALTHLDSDGKYEILRLCKELGLLTPVGNLSKSGQALIQNDSAVRQQREVIFVPGE